MKTRIELYNQFLSGITPRNVVDAGIFSSNRDIILTMLKRAKEAVAQVQPFAKLFQGATDTDTARNVHTFLNREKIYSMDGGSQDIRLPSAFLRTQTGGDCKSYSTFQMAIFTALGIPNGFEFASYDNSRQPSHVYNYIVDRATKKKSMWMALCKNLIGEKNPGTQLTNQW